MGIEEAQKNIGFLPAQIDRLRNADKLDFHVLPELRERRQTSRQIATRNSLHGRDTHDLRRVGSAARDRVFERAGVPIHLLDVLEQALGLVANGDAFAACGPAALPQAGIPACRSAGTPSNGRASAAWPPHARCPGGRPPKIPVKSSHLATFRLIETAFSCIGKSGQT